MIPLESVCLQHINEGQEPLWDELHQLLAQFFILVNLSPRLIGRPFDPSNSPSRSLFVSSESFLSVHIPPSHFEHLHAAVSQLEHDDHLDMVEVKLC